MKRRCLISFVFCAGFADDSNAYTTPLNVVPFVSRPALTHTNSVSGLGYGRQMQIQMSSQSTTESFIQTELRGAAMKLHTREQSPKEGQVESKPRPAYTPTRADYLAFLVDSQYVFQTMEDIANERPELIALRNTGLERSLPLEIDIQFMTSEYNLKRPDVGIHGKEYGEKLRQIRSVPEFICHYYNFYFAHTAGGRMIGKQMSALLLDKKTLEFYKWDGDLNTMKDKVKDVIEAMAASWTSEQRKECVNATAAAFEGGGGINSYLSGGALDH